MKTNRFLLSVALLIGSVPVSQLCGADETSKKSDDTKAVATDHQPTQAELGIGVSPLPPVLASHLPEVIGKGRGILVSEVMKGSPAAKAGLQKHDVLIRYDDQDLYSPEQLVKRVRNDEPGKEIELEYVRGGQLKTTKVKLGEKPMVASIESDWPGFAQNFDVPLIPFNPDFLTEAEDLLKEGTEWTHFESISVMKDEEGKYSAKVKYKDENGDSIERQYTGTRQEVRDAVENDQELPDSQKKQLLRTLDDRGQGMLPDFKFPVVPGWSPWGGRNRFNWPDVKF